MAEPTEQVNTKQEIVDAAKAVEASTTGPMQRLAAALQAEYERQLAFDAARASSSSSPPTPSTSTSTSTTTDSHA